MRMIKSWFMAIGVVAVSVPASMLMVPLLPVFVWVAMVHEADEFTGVTIGTPFALMFGVVWFLTMSVPFSRFI